MALLPVSYVPRQQRPTVPCAASTVSIRHLSHPFATSLHIQGRANTLKTLHMGLSHPLTLATSWSPSPPSMFREIKPAPQASPHQPLCPTTITFAHLAWQTRLPLRASASTRRREKDTASSRHARCPASSVCGRLVLVDDRNGLLLWLVSIALRRDDDVLTA